MAKKYDISDSQLDQILEEVGTLAEQLAKSESKEKKCEMKKDEKPEDKPEEKPPMDGGSPAADGGEDTPPAPGEGAGEEVPPPADGAPATGEQPPEAGMEGQEGGEMSDEELQQIYGSMEPQDLERHYMIIRQVLQGHYSEGAGEGAPAPEAAAPAPAPAPEMGKGEMSGHANGGNAGGGVQAGGATHKFQSDPKVQKDEGGIGATKGGAPHKFQSDSKVQKSEADPEKAAMKAELESLKANVAGLVTALEKSFKPKQKAITGLEYVSKSEVQEIQPSNLSKEDKKAKLTEIVKSEQKRLSVEDRSAINRFFLYGEEDSKIDKIISGGK
jgi:hypothetical protein